VCSEVLEHVPNWRKAITEFYKALKPGGSIVISTPNKLSMYGLTRYPGRLFFGSKHPYDRWKSYFELGRALVSSNFQLSSSLEACYLPGDLSYYNPFKRVIIRLLNLIRSVEGKVSHKWPLNLLGFMIVVRGIKITVSMF
jgi:SAM-dependent methyltransferase